MPSSRPAAWLLALALAAPAAQAGLFDDDEARKAILDMRQRQEQSEARVKAAQAENTAQLLEQINQLKRSLLDLNNQLEVMRTEMAKLRGQDEQLTRDVVELQRLQKDAQQGVEDRIRKLEPQKVSVDGKEILVDPEERRQFEEGMAVLRKGDFSAAASALAGFNRRYPASGYKASSLFWLGNAQYGMRDYKEAMVSFRSLVTTAPDHPRAPESLLAVVNCQMELKDTKGARRTLDELLKTYPKSEAAQAGKERLASIK
ncbi:MAG: tol-pal system protein YbgF [Cytophagales bacterium]|nr:tol-pal system protein YbgF [Rhizobacter sp.]